jgi:MtN3 and saliva related transmembrane protein
MTGIELIGYAAASLTTASLVPQARLLYRTRNTSGVSLGMYGAFTVGVALWLAYGVLLSAWPVILANVVTLALAVTILAMKLRYG